MFKAGTDCPHRVSHVPGLAVLRPLPYNVERTLADPVVSVVDALCRAAMGRLEVETAVARAEAKAAVILAIRASIDRMAATEGPLVQSRSTRLGDPTSMPLPEPVRGDLGPDLSSRNPNQVHDLFWAEASQEVPIQARVRRWAQRCGL